MPSAELYLILRNDKGESTPYQLSRIVPSDGQTACPAWRLKKKDGTDYVVSRDQWGCACTCQDFVYRHKDSKGQTCKHIDSLTWMGLLVQERPRFSTWPGQCPDCGAFQGEYHMPTCPGPKRPDF